MNDKTPEARVRVQRPDANAPDQAVSTKLDAQGHTTGADNDKETGDTNGVVASPTGGTMSTGDSTPDADADLPEPIKPEDIPDPADGGTPHFRPPFSVLGNVVQDGNSRTVAIVGASHMTPEARGKAAIWVAGKLNA